MFQSNLWIRSPAQRVAVVASVALVTFGAPIARGQSPSSWHEPQPPFKVLGNTYYVGTHGITAVLIASKDGHVLIDGTVPEGAAIVADNIRTLGFRLEDVKLILNSHVHFDHAGGLAELQKLSNARVAASEPSAKVLLSGKIDGDDPQYGTLPAIATVPNVQIVRDGERLAVGELTMTAHLTPGHTPGGTTWTWRSCEGSRCLDIVYVDSLNPVSAPGYLYADAKRKPNAAELLERSFVVVSGLPCDLLLAPHPELIDTFGKLARREAGKQDAFVDEDACRRYVADARQRLQRRIAEENKH